MCASVCFARFIKSSVPLQRVGEVAMQLRKRCVLYQPAFDRAQRLVEVSASLVSDSEVVPEHRITRIYLHSFTQQRNGTVQIIHHSCRQTGVVKPRWWWTTGAPESSGGCKCSVRGFIVVRSHSHGGSVSLYQWIAATTVRQRVGHCRSSALKLTHLLVGVSKVHEDGWSRGMLLTHVPFECVSRRCPLLLTQRDEPEVEAGFRIVLAKRIDATEFTLRLLVHSRLVERDAEVTALGSLVIRARWRTRSCTDPDANYVTRCQQTVERLRCNELTKPRFRDDCTHVALAVNEWHQSLFFSGETAIDLHHLVPIHRVHDVERRDLLRDQCPFVDSPGTFQEQRLRVDAMQLHFLVWCGARLEVERTLGPGKQQVNSFLGAQSAIHDRSM